MKLAWEGTQGWGEIHVPSRMLHVEFCIELIRIALQSGIYFCNLVENNIVKESAKIIVKH
jgi:hypothetical protein